MSPFVYYGYFHFGGSKVYLNLKKHPQLIYKAFMTLI